MVTGRCWLQAVNVSCDGLTVATAAFEVTTLTTRFPVVALMSQEPVGSTQNSAAPSGPPTWRSTLELPLTLSMRMSAAATAAPATANTTAAAEAASPRVNGLGLMPVSLQVSGVRLPTLRRKEPPVRQFAKDRQTRGAAPPTPPRVD